MMVDPRHEHIELPNHAAAAYAAEAKWRREQDIESTGERLTLEQRRQAGLEHASGEQGDVRLRVEVADAGDADAREAPVVR